MTSFKKYTKNFKTDPSTDFDPYNHEAQSDIKRKTKKIPEEGKSRGL